MIIKLGTRRLVFLPFTGVKLLMIIFLAVAGVFFILDRWVIPAYEIQGYLDSSPDWEKENWRIRQNNEGKIVNFGPWESVRHKVSKEKHGAKRLLVMGDSYVWGAGYANFNDIWWRQLERELRVRGYQDVEVIAAGLSGYSTKNQLELAQKVVPEYHPDLIIWGYVTNDPDENMLVQMPNDSAAVIKSSVLVNTDYATRAARSLRPLVPVISRRLETLRYNKLMCEHSEFLTYPRWELAILEGKNFEHYRRTLDKLAAFVHEQEAKGAKSFFVTLPNLIDESYFKSRYEKVSKEYQRRNITWIDLLPALIKQYGQDPRPVIQWGTNPADGHPGKTLTRFYARQVADHLELKYKEMLPPKSASSKIKAVRVNDSHPCGLSLTQSAGGLTIEYPADEGALLRLPFNRPYVALGLSEPVVIEEISVIGEGLTSLEIYATYENADYNNKVFVLGTVHGPSGMLNSESFPKQEAVDSLRIHAGFAEKAKRHLDIKFKIKQD